MNGSSADPLCDLVLLTWNRRDLLEPCVERILAHTKIPSRLLIIDNASTDADARAYLDQVKSTAQVEVVVVRRPRNEGYAAGMNAGMALATAPWICLLNNDILVTEGWLSEMLDVAGSNPTIGLLNPMSNEFRTWPHQGETVDAVARRLQAVRGRWIETSSCVGFCVLLSRQLVERIGRLDEAFQFMYFEDADYSQRVRQAGLVCAIAEGAYVYHHGSATMKHDPARDHRFLDNGDRFYRKWKVPRPQRVACVLTTHQPHQASATTAWLRDFANEGHEMWVFASHASSRAVPRHLQIRCERVGRWWLMLYALLRVATKKKPFHRVVLLGGRWERLMRWLSPLHRARVERASLSV